MLLESLNIPLTISENMNMKELLSHFWNILPMGGGKMCSVQVYCIMYLC